MPEADVSVPPESLPVGEAETTPPVVESQETQPPAEPAPPLPSQPASPPAEPPFHEHPRWKELQQEREALRQQNQLLTQMLQRPVQAVLPTPPAADPWEGLVNHTDPQMAQFYQNLQRVVRAERQAAKQEAVQELSPVIQAGMERLAQIDIRDFRRENPEIKPGSEEERLIVAYMNGQMDNGMRHSLESAKRNAMHESLVQENARLKGKQQAIPQRQAANTETSSGIPQQSGLPAKKGTWQERASSVLDKGGSFKDAANAIFG